MEPQRNNEEQQEMVKIKDVVAVVVVSSLPRSGSTFLAELLTSHDFNDTTLFFEPLMPYKKKIRRQQNTNGSFVVGRFLSGLLTCNFSDDFETWLKGKPLFLSYYHPSVERCFRKPAEGGSRCMKRLDLSSVCGRTNTRVVKVVRSRLSWLAGLLQDSGAPQVKIIHLTRDPRASMTSIRKLGWNSDPKVKCKAMHDDLTEYDNLAAKHPRQLLHVSHESMCLDPLTTTKAIFHFIHGTSHLPPSTLRFLRRHTGELHLQEYNNKMYESYGTGARSSSGGQVYDNLNTHSKQNGWQMNDNLNTNSKQNGWQMNDNLNTNSKQNGWQMNDNLNTHSKQKGWQMNDNLKTHTSRQMKDNLNSHSRQQGWQEYDDMDTRRQSWREYDAWRWEISSQQLLRIEEEELCKDVVDRLGHVLFHTLHNARNASISLEPI
ncbi:hypothetical protein Pcinc_024317 [Petrolisthes cinctipes]|uniref:Sulfotransferase domain-containing protein n=1 Tax=Petrolisthes cinctipes TaxID=88211 RepID=A0AAE1KAZ3_PETCI|nr:hypothetical protein Pcinc_024317 [Petrolisthes cinctipes]